ncbi:hypothetical protein [Tautonia sociabilis]|uniref:Uncharacterized protein n=1 Tax=Tautonia sociabilis TaxID=2080755 RepID=A0A432MNU2_9BACT|nr:hypothetical protein [Tautonia sociabilis]RUL88765.1 hypothetical protein TsocGM_05250 [Tautonia sociabilis]
MERGTSRRERLRRVGRWAILTAAGLAIGSVMTPSGAGARQEGRRPAPSLNPSRPAPGLDTGRAGSPPGLAPRPAPAATDPSIDPSIRYRFIEAYAPPDQPGAEIGPFRVAFVETLDQSIEVPGSAPRRTQLGYRVVYVARPAIVGGLDNRQVSALVRHYEVVQPARDGQPDDRLAGPAGLVGQTLWFQDDGRLAPSVLTLPGSPPLTEEQLGFVAYRQLVVPKLSGLLSPVHVAVGSSWGVPNSAAQVLVDDLITESSLEATLEDVLPPAAGETTSRAIIRLTGRLQLVNSSATINARLEFAFEDPSPQDAEGAAPRELSDVSPRMVDVQGAVVRLLMAQREILEIPGPDGRIAARATQVRSLNLERRLQVEAGAVPSLPPSPPTPTPENSWVIYRDPDDRFLFRHPQDYRPASADPGDGDTINLERRQVGGVPDYLTFVFFPRGDVPPEVRPEDFSQKIVEVWRSVPGRGVTIGRGAEGFLPEAQWPGMRVYRVELPLSYEPALYALADSGTAYFSAYLIQLANGAVLEVEGLSERPPEAFRQETEAILKTFIVDPPPLRAQGQPAVAPPSSPSPSSPTAPEPGGEEASPSGDGASPPPSPTAPGSSPSAPGVDPEAGVPPAAEPIPIPIPPPAE